MVEQVVLSDALLAGAKEVFETMVFMDIEESSEPGREIEDWALLGSITFKNGFEGCLTICCSVACAKSIALNMLGMDPASYAWNGPYMLGMNPVDEIRVPEICDAIGEVTNMIMGSVKSRLQKDFGNLEVSIPSVVSGRKLENNLGDRASKTSVKVNIKDEYIAELTLLYRESSE